MRDYAKVSPQFWIGATGKALRAAGIEAQVVAMYLMTSPHANMLGLYYVPTMYIAHETGMTLEGACKGLQRASEAGFCEYDEASEVVWVHEMARFQIADNLKASDNRCKGVQAEYDALPENPYLTPFFERYGESFHMESCRGKGRDLQGASKPLRSQEQEQEQEQEQASAPASPAPSANPNPKPKREKSARPTKHALPADFGISDAVREWAVGKGYTRLDEHLEAFRAKALANGYTYADWDAAFREAIRGDWAKLGATGNRGTSSPGSPPATPHRKRLGEGSSTDYGIPGIGTPYAARAAS